MPTRLLLAAPPGLVVYRALRVSIWCSLKIDRLVADLNKWSEAGSSNLEVVPNSDVTDRSGTWMK